MCSSDLGASLNYVGNNKIGSVGKAIPNTEIKIANDGEILLKGDHVMPGYYKNQQALKANFKSFLDHYHNAYYK